MNHTVLKICLIGLGAMGLNHLRVLSKDKNCEVVAICDANPSLSAVAQNYGRAFYGDVSEMLENEAPDAADICVPTMLHEKTAVACLKQGLHVFVEKPIAHNSAAAESMIREAAKRKKVLMVGHVERFNPAVTALKSSLESEEVISLSFTRVGPTPPRIKDVGVIADLGIHDIDLARYLSGTEVERVFCASYKRNGTDDCVQMLLRMEGGISAQLTVNWITPYKVRSIGVVTLNKVYAADLLRNEVKAFSNYSLNPNPSCTMESIPTAYAEPLAAEIAHFVECVQGGKKVLVDGSEALKALKIAEAAVKSAAASKCVSV